GGRARRVEGLEVGPAAAPGPGHDVAQSVPAQIACGHRAPAGEARVVGEERPQDRAIRTAEDPDVRAAAGAGRGDDVRHAVALDVADRHVHAPGEARVVGEERPQDRAVEAAHDLDVRTAAGTGPGHDVRHAVPVDVAHGHP